MEEYLEKLLAQIRCKKARPYIAEEIRGHIESQIEDNIVSGMTDQEAEKNAPDRMEITCHRGNAEPVGDSIAEIHYLSKRISSSGTIYAGDVPA